MKASELIKALEDAKDKHGDLEVVAEGDNWRYQTSAVCEYAGEFWIEH